MHPHEGNGSPEDRRLQIAVAGGSIGGLCAGLALHGSGFDVNVYERHPGPMDTRGAGIVVQGELAKFPDFPLKKVTEKGVTIKSARGHSYRACELAVRQLASRRFPLELLTTHTFGLSGVDEAIRTVGGAAGADGVVHVSLLPGKD